VARKINDIPITGGLATSTSRVVYLSYGTKLTFLPALYDKPFWQRVGVGLNVKGVLTETLQQTGQIDRSAAGWDLDLGVLYRPTDWSTVGLSWQSLLEQGALGGGVVHWDVGGDEPLPDLLRLGGSAKVIGDIDSPIFMEGKELLLAGEICAASKGSLLRAGGELGLNRQFFVRAGLMQQFQLNGVTSDFNFGLGWRAQNWGIDLAGYREPIRGDHYVSLSLLYFPTDWVLLRKLELQKPQFILENAIEKISLGEDEVVVYDDKIEIFGKAKPGVAIYINDALAYIDEAGNFKATVPLNLGKNLIVAEARYKGDKKMWKYKVLRKAKVALAAPRPVKEKVEELVTMGVIEIKPGQDLVMDAGITRGELATWIVKAAGVKLPPVDRDVYADVPKDHPLAAYIKVVGQLNLLRPFPDGTFRPEAIVSRVEGEQIFKMMEGRK